MEIVNCRELSLKNIKISGDIAGKFGTFEVEQTFVNNTKNVLEINYTFPIIETATVTGFTVNVGDKIIKGTCKEKKEAEKEYCENLVKGNSAYMLNQDAENIFNVSIGKVDKGEEVKVTITYIDVFEIADNEIKIIIPTLVSHRYKSAVTTILNYGKVDYKVDFNINISKAINFNNVISPTHNIKMYETKNEIKIESLNYDACKDFILNVKLKEELSSNAVFSKTQKGEEIICLSFMPEIGEKYEDSEKEYIFIMDISGSMKGRKLDETKRAIKECLKQLDEGDKFNIIPFESEYTAFAVESVEYNEENFKKAEEFIETLKAGGGTEILLPIKFALYEQSDDKVIMLFTDGQVGNENQILNFVSNNINNSKLFVFGIDTSINTSFIRKIAKVGNGKSEFIHPGEKIDDKIIRTFARIQTPLVEGLVIDYGSNKLIDEIKEENNLFNYEFYNVIAKIEKLQDDISLKGKIADEEYEWKIRKDDIKQFGAKLEVVLAKLQINRLEEYIEIMPHDKNEAYVKMIIDISTKYNIATKYTTFISVYERENKMFEIPEIQKIVLSDEMIEKSFNSQTINSLDVPCFLRKTKCSQMKPKRISFWNNDEDFDFDDEEYEDKNKEKIEKYFLKEKINTISTLLLIAIYFYNNNSKILKDKRIISVLENNIENIRNDEKLMNITYILYLNSSYTVAKYIYENVLSDKFKKIVDTKLKYIPKFEYEKIEDRKIEDNIETRIDEVLMNLNRM